jgi:hypothetical protein
MWCSESSPGRRYLEPQFPMKHSQIGESKPMKVSYKIYTHDLVWTTSRRNVSKFPRTLGSFTQYASILYPEVSRLKLGFPSLLFNAPGLSRELGRVFFCRILWNQASAACRSVLFFRDRTSLLKCMHAAFLANRTQGSVYAIFRRKPVFFFLQQILEIFVLPLQKSVCYQLGKSSVSCQCVKYYFS